MCFMKALHIMYPSFDDLIFMNIWYSCNFYIEIVSKYNHVLELLLKVDCALIVWMSSVFYYQFIRFLVTHVRDLNALC